MNPINVDNNLLNIDEIGMTLYQRYDFHYLGIDMVAVRTEGGLEIYRLMDYLDVDEKGVPR